MNRLTWAAIAIAVVIVAGCGDGTKPLKWGEVYAETSSALCSGYYDRCSEGDDSNYAETCTDFNVGYACAHFNDCAEDMPAELESTLDACLEAIAVEDCAALLWGEIPPECWDLY